MPLGIEASAERDEDRCTLLPGSTVVLYTDGLVEARTMPLGTGLTRLLEAAAGAPTHPDALLDHLLEHLGAFDPARNDDVAMLAIHFEPVTTRRLDLELEAAPSALASMRRHLRTWLAPLELDAQETMDVLVAAGEACANAIEHPLDPFMPTVRIEARLDDGELELRIRDAGGWREPRHRPERGLGMPLMERLMDEVAVIPSPAGTEVRLRRRLRSGRAAGVPA
jgi:anti-sigma regulatory factor (Ser/Thr protein kinase)